MAKTYDPISTQTLGSAQASVTFSSIPATYTDLVLVCNYAGATGGGTDSVPAIRFNGDTGTNYSDTILRGDGSSATSGRHSSSSYIQISGSNVSNTAWATFKVDVMNYSNATTNKTAISRNSQSDVVVNSVVGLWRNTAAITSITIILASGTFKIGSTFTLYGILAA